MRQLTLGLAAGLACASTVHAAPPTAQAACATKPDETLRCWASEDEHMPQLDNGQVELTTLLHVTPSYDPSACQLVARWSGSEQGATAAVAPASVSTERDGRVAHWRIHFPLAAADAAVRIEQTVTCPGGAHFDATARTLAADGAAHRVCTAHHAKLPAPDLHVGDTEVTLAPASNVLWRVTGTQWIDSCTSTVILDTAQLTRGTLRAFVPDTKSPLSAGEQALAVRAAGATPAMTADEIASELPSAVIHFDHALGADDVRAVQAMLAPAAATLVIHGDHPSPRPR